MRRAKLDRSLFSPALWFSSPRSARLFSIPYSLHLFIEITSLFHYYVFPLSQLRTSPSLKKFLCRAATTNEISTDYSLTKSSDATPHFPSQTFVCFVFFFSLSAANQHFSVAYVMWSKYCATSEPCATVSRFIHFVTFDRFSWKV